MFQELSGEESRCGSPYGEIQLTHFSRLAEIIKWSLGRPIPFCASVYYLQQYRASFVVTKNLAAHITVSMFYIHFNRPMLGECCNKDILFHRLSRMPMAMH